MKINLDAIETRLQNFIENSLNLLPGRHPTRLIHQLVQALERTIVQQSNGKLTTSNIFTIQLHPQDAAIWQDNPGLLPALARVLEDAVETAGLHLPEPVSLHLQSDSSQKPDSFLITSSTRRTWVEATTALPVTNTFDPPTLDPRPLSSFLIIHNNRTFPLRLAVINIGRRADNHLVLEDQRVSRVHAQLRAVQGRYILFDLNSTGGTFVNNVRISQIVLKPGDVISLAGFALIYGEDSTQPRPSISDTQAQLLP